MNTPVREGETIEGSRTTRNRPYPAFKCSTNPAIFLRTWRHSAWIGFSLRSSAGSFLRRKTSSRTSVKNFASEQEESPCCMSDCHCAISGPGVVRLWAGVRDVCGPESDMSCPPCVCFITSKAKLRRILRRKNFTVKLGSGKWTPLELHHGRRAAQRAHRPGRCE